MRLLVTRPRPGGAATAERLRAAGHDVIEAPLLVTEAIAWTPPTRQPDAIMLTSAAAARLARPDPALLALPCHAVGAATAVAAYAAGFTDVRVGDGTAQQLVDGLHGSLLHLAGEDQTAIVVPADLHIATVIVYRARLLPLAAMPAVDAVLLYSPRTARHFAREHDRLGLVRGSLAIAALSPAVAAAAGDGWARTILAAAPDENALLAALAAAWQ